MTINDELIFNYLLDARKKEISPMNRARLINEYLKQQNMSIRELSRSTGIHHNTLQDWCMFGRLTDDQYKELKEEKELNDTQIYRQLRNNKKQEVSVIMSDNKIQFSLKEAIKLLDGIKRRPDNSKKTKDLIDELQNILNIMKMYNEKKV